MFARRFVKSISSVNAARPFTTTSQLCRAPALADITPAGVASFESKQKKFRERMIEQTKLKDTSKYSGTFLHCLVQNCPTLPLLQL